MQVLRAQEVSQTRAKELPWNQPEESLIEDQLSHVIYAYTCRLSVVLTHRGNECF